MTRARYLPAVTSRRTGGDADSADEPRTDKKTHSESRLWIALAGFLSRKAPTTRSTYELIFKEWCSYLQIPLAPTPATTRRLLSVNEIDAAAYCRWLEARPGEKPRMKSSESDGNAQTTLVRRDAKKTTKKTGLEHTLSNATIAKKIAALRRMYRVFQSVEPTLRINPFSTDLLPPPPKEAGRKRPTEMVDFSLVKKILAQPDIETAKGLRDRAILCALFGGALRRSEAVGLHIGDVQRTTKGTVFLYLRSTKARKDARQALPRWAAEPILALVAQREHEGARPGDRLFISYTGRGGAVPTRQPVSASGIYKLFLHYCRKAGVDSAVTPHSARATAITKLLADGLPHREVKEFSRHSSIQMVEVYDKRRMGVDDNAAKELEFDE